MLLVFTSIVLFAIGLLASGAIEDRWDAIVQFMVRLWQAVARLSAALRGRWTA